MAYTTAQLVVIISTLETGLGTGAAVIQFGDRRIEYRSNKEILDAIAYFKSLLGSASDAVSPHIRQTRLYSNKGF